MRRKIISFQFTFPQYAPIGTGRKVWLLECGHTKSKKASVPVPKTTDCDECQMDKELVDDVFAKSRSN